MDIQEAVENALVDKILARQERCPWELAQAARDYKRINSISGQWTEYYRNMLEKYADRLPDWLED